MDEDAAVKTCGCCPLLSKLYKWWRRRRNNRRQKGVRQQAKDDDAKNTDEGTGDTSKEAVWHCLTD